MPKSSKQQAAENRQSIVAAASELFRGQGFRSTSVPELMQAAGMTHGGFYGHFASKEALGAEAIDSAFNWLHDWIAEFDAEGQTGPRAAAEAMVSTYLDDRHRDMPTLGCPVAALANDIAREPADSPLRDHFGRGVEAVVNQLLETGMARDEQTVLTDYATLMGALVLARATAGRPISEKFLNAARNSLIPEA